MLYEDYRHVQKFLPVGVLFLGILGFICMLQIGHVVRAILIILVGAAPFVNLVICETKRENCKKHGACLSGQITMAYKLNIDRYCLVISFFDEVEKQLVSEIYTRNPNYFLKDCNCKIYKWKETYVESDFNTRDEVDMSLILQIPICDESLPLRKIGKVKAV